MATRPIVKPSDASERYADEILEWVLDRFRAWLAGKPFGAGSLVRGTAETFDDHVRVQVFVLPPHLLPETREYASAIEDELGGEGHFVSVYVRTPS